ncbi:unnamed protein product [Dovyalis caffra]|uniref:Maturase K n=1 Tax=Dovyalis caffra TaxID=77055 RepID=A0AAV1QP89_9ROSI|nr:unnamed protein product [Dovyalis caffra]
MDLLRDLNGMLKAELNLVDHYGRFATHDKRPNQRDSNKNRTCLFAKALRLAIFFQERIDRSSGMV